MQSKFFVCSAASHILSLFYHGIPRAFLIHYEWTNMREESGSKEISSRIGFYISGWIWATLFFSNFCTITISMKKMFGYFMKTLCLYNSLSKPKRALCVRCQFSNLTYFDTREFFRFLLRIRALSERYSAYFRGKEFTMMSQRGSKYFLSLPKLVIFHALWPLLRIPVLTLVPFVFSTPLKTPKKLPVREHDSSLIIALSWLSNFVCVRYLRLARNDFKASGVGMPFFRVRLQSEATLDMMTWERQH